eukprot:gene1548-2180_t
MVTYRVAALSDAGVLENRLQHWQLQMNIHSTGAIGSERIYRVLYKSPIGEVQLKVAVSGTDFVGAELQLERLHVKHLENSLLRREPFPLKACQPERRTSEQSCHSLCFHVYGVDLIDSQKCDNASLSHMSWARRGLKLRETFLNIAGTVGNLLVQTVPNGITYLVTVSLRRGLKKLGNADVSKGPLGRQLDLNASMGNLAKRDSSNEDFGYTDSSVVGDSRLNASSRILGRFFIQLGFELLGFQFGKMRLVDI